MSHAFGFILPRLLHNLIMISVFGLSFVSSQYVGHMTVIDLLQLNYSWISHCVYVMPLCSGIVCFCFVLRETLQVNRVDILTCP